MPVEEKDILKVLIGQRAEILAYIDYIIRDHGIAEDVFQEVSIYAIQKKDTINDHQHLVRWITRVSRNLALKAIEKKRKNPVNVNHKLLDLFEADLQELEDKASSPMYGALKKCLTHLTPYANQLITLRYGKGFSGQKIADHVNRKIHTVYVALSRIHKTLSSCIKEQYDSKGINL